MHVPDPNRLSQGFAASNGHLYHAGINQQWEGTRYGRSGAAVTGDVIGFSLDCDRGTLDVFLNAERLVRSHGRASPQLCNDGCVRACVRACVHSGHTCSRSPVRRSLRVDGGVDVWRRRLPHRQVQL